MNKVQPRRPSGFSEYLPGEQIEFNRLLTIIRSTYEKYGFTPLDTPDLELTDVLLAKGGGETEQQVYSFTREGSDTSLTLRYDLTVPLARYVAEHQSDLVFPFSRYHIGKVHRAERAQAGRGREFYQCDIDTIGSLSPAVDAQFPAVINEIFQQFGFGEFVIRINNRHILNGFFEGIGASHLAAQILRTIDKMEKISHEALLEQLATLGLDAEQVEQIVTFTSLKGSNDEMIAQLRDLGDSSQLFTEGIDRLEKVVKALRDMQVPEHRFAIDLKIARGLDYYTGVVYETILVDYPQVGSVCSGGRYDDLASYYTSMRLPGVGISIGLTRLFYAMRELGVITAEQKTPAVVLVLPIDETHQAAGFAAATRLRAAAISTLLNTEYGKFGDRMRYADRLGVQHVVVIGDDEAANSSVTLKTMTSGASEQLSLDELVARLAQEV